MVKRLTCILLMLARAAAACEAPPPARIDIDANSYYSDKHHSVIDPVLRARNIANTKPIEDFLSQVADECQRRRRCLRADVAVQLGRAESVAGQDVERAGLLRAQVDAGRHGLELRAHSTASHAGAARRHRRLVQVAG
jgi:hypothetical protein